jgi:hypothetical protein
MFSWPEFYRRIGLLYREILDRNGNAGAEAMNFFER